MDVVLTFTDAYFFTPYVYPTSWAEDDIWRQFISLNIVTNLGGLVLYLLTATLSYFFVFDHRLLQHPLILENQVYKEITYTLKAIPWMGLLTSLTFLAEVRGYSKLYDSVDDSRFGWLMIGTSVLTFLMFTDCLIYWIHRGLHHKRIYKYLLLYVFVNIWTVSIHDGDFRVPQILQPFVNGSAHHTDHHVYYNYNYGQYFTIWDRLGGSFRYPSSYEGNGPMDDVLRKEKQGLGKVLNGAVNGEVHHKVNGKVE